MPLFTEKQYREILKARERLGKCKLKDYGYPPYPEEEKLLAPLDSPWTKNQWDAVQQLKAMVLYLQGKVLSEKTKREKKYNKYELE